MDLVDWPEEEKRQFLVMQCQAQQVDYAMRFPDSEHSIVLLDNQPIGRIWVARQPEEIRLVDITLAPAHRRAGTGELLIRRLQAEAADADVPLRHSVFVTNTLARRLYTTLGFQIIGDRGMYVSMEWTNRVTAAY